MDVDRSVGVPTRRQVIKMAVPPAAGLMLFWVWLGVLLGHAVTPFQMRIIAPILITVAAICLWTALILSVLRLRRSREEGDRLQRELDHAEDIVTFVRAHSAYVHIQWSPGGEVAQENVSSYCGQAVDPARFTALLRRTADSLDASR